MIYLPVKYKGMVLMPMKASRVRRFIKAGKGKLRYNSKLNQHYLQLLVPPSDYNLKEVTLGIDPGSVFDGFSIVSGNKHLTNIELIQRPKKVYKNGVVTNHNNSVSNAMLNRSSKRRLRRSKLRSRPVRYDNRRTDKLTPTHRSNNEFRIWLINQLIKLYPISKVVIEDVKYNHYKGGGNSFSNVEIGKSHFLRYLESKFKVEKVRGWVTKQLRINLLGYDPKRQGIKDKGILEFESHCLDSFVLACNKYYPVDKVTGEIDVSNVIPDFNKNNINKIITVIKKKVKNTYLGSERVLFASGKSYQNRSRRPAQLVKTVKGGKIVKKLNQLSNKFNICRVKICEDQGNHGPWKYINNGKSLRKRCFPQIIKQKNYKGNKRVYKPQGGSVKDGVNKWFSKLLNQYVRREIQVIKPLSLFT